MKVPVGGGDLMAGLGYRKSELTTESDVESELWTLNVGYAYALSKRTSLYGAVGYAEEEFALGPDGTWDAKVWQAGVGIVHTF